MRHTAVLDVLGREKSVYVSTKLSVGALAKLRKANIGIVISVSLSVCLSARNNSAPTERVFTKFDILVFFENLSRKFKIR